MNRSLVPLVVVACGIAALGFARQGDPVTPGYSRAAATREREVERDAIARPTPASAQAHSRALAKETHVAGTPAQARTRDYVIAQMKAWGLETEVRSYNVFMPHPTLVRVARVSPEPRELRLAEPAVIGDRTSSMWQYPTVNGYSGAGDVTAEVVYVNYGLIEDYAQLDSMGVSVSGKIAIARYGRSFRGIKAREAEKHGAVALLIYSDPQDDGFTRGDVYPEGPMRPSFGVQRGSVMNANGDPSTPGYPSTAGARRADVASMPIPRIPVVPISHGNAVELLRHVRGQDVPATWQGGMPIRYHIGPGPTKARVVVEDDRATRPMKPIHDTFGMIRGTEFPDELVIIGSHRDGWGPGAADNVSGTVSVLEAARTLAEMAKQGIRPKRTVIFATWDAEEWGLIGSTEYVEDDSLRLMRNAVAYLNQDVAAQGASFGGSGAPSLRSTLRDVVRGIPDPNGKGSVYDEWRRASAVADSLEPAMGDPGGGSDFAGFYNHLGIPIAEWSFGGPGGVYHSQYDGTSWMERFGDPGYKYHATAGRIAAAMILRIANADILPYDYVEMARTVKRYVPAIDRALAAKRWDLTGARIASALDAMETRASAFASARQSALERGIPRARVEQTNRALIGVERALTRPNGLMSRPWFRNLIYVADENNGYANMPLPSVNEAIRKNDRALVAAEIDDLVNRINDATRAIDAALAALGG